MTELKGKEFIEAFLAHPNPVVYSHCPEIPELCSAVVPQADGTFNNRSPRMGLGSFLLEAAAARDVRNVPWLPFLRGPILETIFGHDVAIVFSLKVPMLPTITQLEKLGLVYAS